MLALPANHRPKRVAKAGTIGITGVYPPQCDSFPVGTAMNRNLTIKPGNCNHRRYVPRHTEQDRIRRSGPHSGLDAA
jgi:threonine dehydrogenase-like Zn-dependent dehydrogenase